jgi:hypothetical protein
MSNALDAEFCHDQEQQESLLTLQNTYYIRHVTSSLPPATIHEQGGMTLCKLWSSIFILLCGYVSSSWDPALKVKSAISILEKTEFERQAPNLPLELNKLQYHGTTTLSFIHDGCVVLCIDSKASVGNYVGSRCVKKIFPVSKSIVATMAGGAADCAYWIRRIATAAKGIEYRYSAKLNAGAIARLLASSLREYRGMGKLALSTKSHSPCTVLTSEWFSYIRLICRDYGSWL